MKYDSIIREARKNLEFQSSSYSDFKRHNNKIVTYSEPCFSISKDHGDHAGGSGDLRLSSQPGSQGSGSDGKHGADGGNGGDSDPDDRRSLPASPKKLFKFNDLSGAVGLCRSRIYALIQVEQFPRPIKIGKSARWVVAEIDDWIARKVHARDTQLARGRHA